MDQDEDLDDYDRARASDMDERPIYPGPDERGKDSPEIPDTQPIEAEV